MTSNSGKTPMDEFAQLANLGLSPAEWQAIRRTGYIVKDSRQRQTYFKLRFRLGKQRVKSLGKDAHFANEVSQELIKLQAERNAIRQLRKDRIKARRALRQGKETLTHALKEYGFTFHGFSIRKSRAISDLVVAKSDHTPKE